MMLVRFGPAIKTGGFKIRAWFLFLWLSTDCINLQEVRQPYEEILLSCLTFNFQSFRPGVQCTIAAEQTQTGIHQVRRVRYRFPPTLKALNSRFLNGTRLFMIVFHETLKKKSGGVRFEDPFSGKGFPQWH